MNDDKLKILFTDEDIRSAIKRLSDEITKDYQGKTPLLIGILKGSFIFMADLIRSIKIPIEVDFIKVSSYGAGKKSRGKVDLLMDFSSSIEGKDVIVIEDIIDSGLTLDFLMKELIKRKPSSLKLCTLIDKKYRRKREIQTDYVGFTIESGYVVGYGFDYDEQYRQLNSIYVLEE